MIIMDDGIRLADQVITRTKVAKNELLATGKVTIKENNLDLTVDYGVPEDQTQYQIDTGAGAQLFVDEALQGILDASIAKGNAINGMVTSRAVLNMLRKNAIIQGAVNGNAGVGRLVSNADLRAYLSEEYGIDNIILNDLTYGVPAAEVGGRPHVEAKRYYPAAKITFFSANPNGKLGDGLWGDPPETDVAQFIDVAASGESPYVYVSQWSEKDPAVLWTKASALFMPVLYNPNSLFIANVIATPGV